MFRSYLFLLCASVSSILAANVPIPNGSFERPETQFVELRLDDWKRTPKPEWYDESNGFTWDQLTGIFANTAADQPNHIHNVDGKQAAYVFGVPTAGLVQDFSTAPTQPQFEAGHSYTLTLAVSGGSGNMPEGATLMMALFYPDVTGAPVIVAMTNISHSIALFPDTTNFVDIAVSSPIIARDSAAVGKRLGVQIISTAAQDKSGGYWNIDNVRLADSISLQNNSFELPQTDFVTNTFVGWGVAPKPEWYDESQGFFWSQLTGIFANAPEGAPNRKENIDGRQAAYMFALPQVSLFQDASTGLDLRYDIGRAYEFSLGISGGGGGMTNPAALMLSFYYLNDAGVETTISALPVVFSTNTFPTPTRFHTFAVRTPATRATDPWAGKPVGVRILSALMPEHAGGYWDIDNAQIAALQSGVLDATLRNGSLIVRLTAEPGQRYDIVSSDSLSRAANEWTKLTTVTATNGVAEVTVAPSQQRQFFQARPTP